MSLARRADPSTSIHRGGVCVGGSAIGGVVLRMDVGCGVRRRGAAGGAHSHTKGGGVGQGHGGGCGQPRGADTLMSDDTKETCFVGHILENPFSKAAKKGPS